MNPSSASRKRTLRIRLFVAGNAPNSVAAIRNLRKVLAAHADITTQLQIIDVLKHPALGLSANVLVTPTLIKLGPPVERRVVGSLSDTEALMTLLGLHPPGHETTPPARTRR